MSKNPMIEAVARAMRDAVILDDEGEFPCLFDLLGFSGENKAHTVTDGLAQAAINALRRYDIENGPASWDGKSPLYFIPAPEPKP